MVNIDVGGAVGGVADAAASIIKLFKKDPTLAATLEDKERERDLQRDLQQILLNIEEARQGLFKGGWRPFIGWTCGVALCYNYVLQPFLVFGFTMAGFGAEVGELPDLSMVDIIMLVGGMLGMSKLRSSDKEKGLHLT